MVVNFKRKHTAMMTPGGAAAATLRRQADSAAMFEHLIDRRFPSKLLYEDDEVFVIRYHNYLPVVVTLIAKNLELSQRPKAEGGLNRDVQFFHGIVEMVADWENLQKIGYFAFFQDAATGGK